MCKVVLWLFGCPAFFYRPNDLWPRKKATHLVVLGKANKHCKPAASVLKPNRNSQGMVEVIPESLCQSQSAYPSIIEWAHNHAAQLLYPVSSLRKYLSQLCPGHALHGDIRDLMLLRFYNSGQVNHCIVYQPVEKHFNTQQYLWSVIGGCYLVLSAVHL